MSFCLFVLFAILDYMSIVEMNKKEKLSPHFTLGEMTKTSHRTADGNIPSHVAIENLKRLCGWLEMPSRCGARRYGCISQSVRKAIAGRQSSILSN